MNLLGVYDISATFNVSNIFLFEVGDDSRMKSFKERRNETIQTTLEDLLEVLVGLMTRRRVFKRFNKAFNGLLQATWALQ
jgi:hypothetical protein